MADRVVNLGLTALPSSPATDNVQPGRTAKRLHVHQMLSAQDHPINGGRRILAYYSWGGEYEHQFGHSPMYDGDGSGEESFPRSPYPTQDDARALLVLDGVPVTPGCGLRVHATVLQPGPTFTADTISGGSGNDEQPYTRTGAYGLVALTATWDDGSTTETVISAIDFSSNAQAPNRVDDDEGAAWSAMLEGEALNAPAGILFDPAEVVQWSAPGVTVDMTLTASGAARVVDVVVYEVPLKFGITDGDTPGPAHIYAENELPRTGFPDEYPTEGASSGDERYGTTYAVQVATAQETQLGPGIWCFSSRRERHDGRGWASSANPDPATVTGTSETILGASSSGVTTESPSIELGSGAYGRRLSQSDPSQVMAENGTCRVVFAANWSVSAGTGTLQLKATDYSYYQLSTTSTSYGWSKVSGDLAVGAHPLDGFTGLVTGWNSGSNDTRIRYAWLHYWPE